METTDLQLAVEQQYKICELNRCIDDILLTLTHSPNLSLKHCNDQRINGIHQEIEAYKKALSETEEGRRFLEKKQVRKM